MHSKSGSRFVEFETVGWHNATQDIGNEVAINVSKKWSSVSNKTTLIQSKVSGDLAVRRPHSIVSTQSGALGCSSSYLRKERH